MSPELLIDVRELASTRPCRQIGRFAACELALTRPVRRDAPERTAVDGSAFLDVCDRARPPGRARADDAEIPGRAACRTDDEEVIGTCAGGVPT